MLPPYLWHCLLSLRLEPLGQYIANPIDREDLVVDGALRDSWHGLFLNLIGIELVYQWGDFLLLEAIFLKKTGSNLPLLHGFLSLGRLLVDPGGST